MTGGDPACRTRRLLDEAKYLTLATVSEDGQPWSAVLQYAWLGDPLRLLFGSAIRSRHCRHIAARPRVSGTLFVAGNEFGAVDGAQFTGRCAELAADELDRFHGLFYEAVLPDPRLRAKWMLPRQALLPPAGHRLYLIDVEHWWLLDTRTRERDHTDRRMEIPLAELALR